MIYLGNTTVSACANGSAPLVQMYPLGKAGVAGHAVTPVRSGEKDQLMPPTSDILIVDDNDSIVELMSEVLHDEGYTTRAAMSGDEALLAVISQRPALVLLDIHLPGITGIAFLEQLAQRGLAELPVIMMTADAGAADGLAQQGIPCLHKPFTLEELLACAARYVPPPPRPAP